MKILNREESNKLDEILKELKYDDSLNDIEVKHKEVKHLKND